MPATTNKKQYAMRIAPDALEAAKTMAAMDRRSVGGFIEMCIIEEQRRRIRLNNMDQSYAKK
jgi:hypothetical protein